MNIVKEVKYEKDQSGRGFKFIMVFYSLMVKKGAFSGPKYLGIESPKAPCLQYKLIS